MRILHAIHDFLPRHRAGSEIYAAALCRELRARHHVTVVCADYAPARGHGQLAWRIHDGVAVVEITNNWICATFGDTYRSPVISARLNQVLDIVQPHVLHVHNLLNLSFDLPSAARTRRIPVVATLHDYTLVCPSGGQRLHRAESHVCRSIDPERCARCFPDSPFHDQAMVAPLAKTMARSDVVRRVLVAARARLPRLTRAAAAIFGHARRMAVTPADITGRLARARELFGHIDLFVAPSASIADEFAALGVERGRIRVSDYGFAPLARAERPSRTGLLRIGFVGTRPGVPIPSRAPAHIVADCAPSDTGRRQRRRRPSGPYGRADVRRRIPRQSRGRRRGARRARRPRNVFPHLGTADRSPALLVGRPGRGTAVGRSVSGDHHSTGRRRAPGIRDGDSRRPSHGARRAICPAQGEPTRGPRRPAGANRASDSRGLDV